MISVMKFAEVLTAGRFPVERKENDQGKRLRTIYPHFLVWEAEKISLQNNDLCTEEGH